MSYKHIDLADDLARRGWSQPDIRQHLISHHGASWLHADVAATDAVRRDNLRECGDEARRAA